MNTEQLQERLLSIIEDTDMLGNTELCIEADEILSDVEEIALDYEDLAVRLSEIEDRVIDAEKKWLSC